MPKDNGSKKAKKSEFERCVQLPSDYPSLNTLTRMDIDNRGVKMSIVPLPTPYRQPLPNIRLLPPLAKESDPIDIDSDAEDGEDEEELMADNATPTQTRTVINQFMEQADLLQDLIMLSYDDRQAGQPCSCGKGLRTVRCLECFQHTISCPACFVEAHYHHPFHWARLWDPETRHFKKVDYSVILNAVDDTAAIQLGHTGERRSCPFNDNTSVFVITHTNGIHTTRLRTCQCPNAPSKLSQLMTARLFPATITDPRSAFTFAALKEFHMHGIQSKSAAFDYVLSIRRLTDKAFTQTVSDTYKAFLRVSRVWDFLNLRKWVGQAHGIDALLPHRPPGNITSYCPSCPEIGVNTTEEEVRQCPPQTRHLITNFKTVDGNHHANRYAKNSDRNDVSLWEGFFSYFPGKQSYKEYLDAIPAVKEKSVCNFITAVNAQDKKKFRGCDETGVINVQCSHVIVESCVDMYYGEKFCYPDFAIARSLDTRPHANIPLVVAYDCSCSYAVNIHSRFSEHLPRHADTIARALFTIDSLHVHDHQDRCIYLFSTYYHENLGHFDAVGTEQVWAENNQLGPQCRQMNPGHRQDKLVEGSADWNQKKVVRMPRRLARDLRVSWANYVEKRDFFKPLSEVLSEEVPKWALLDRRPKVTAKGEVESVYRHSSSKVLSVDTVVKRLLQDNSSSEGPLSSGGNASTSVVLFLAEGISIKGLQLHLSLLIEKNQSHPLIATQRDITAKRDEVKKRLEYWRELQTIHMLAAKSQILELEPRQTEREHLFLPSEFSQEERREWGIEELAELEAELWEGQAAECILRLRCIGKTISSFKGLRQKNISGQHDSTRSHSKIHTIEFLQARVFSLYQESRHALASLGKLDSMLDRFPHLTTHDLNRKSTQHKRTIGDTHRTDGPLYGLDVKKLAYRGATKARMVANPVSEAYGTSTSQSVPNARIGRLWDPATGLSDEDFKEWEREEDRVQWFRAWAEMMRWMEEFELKHAEFTRCIRSFRKMSDVWASLAAKSTRPGYAGFAHQQSTMYYKLSLDTEKLFHEHGERRLVYPETTLAAAVRSFRKDELAWFYELAQLTDNDAL